MTTDDPIPPPPPDRATPHVDEPHRVIGGVLVRRDEVKVDGRSISFYDATPE